MRVSRIVGHYLKFKLKGYLQVACAACLSFLVTDVVADTVHHTDLWTSLSYYHDIPGSGLNLYVNPQLRFIDERYKIKQINLYLGLSYHVNENLEFLLGVFRGCDRNTDGDYGGENRLWQQASIDFYESNIFSFFGRTRVEERIRNGTNQYATRLRQQFAIEKPLSEPYHLIIGNEFFLQITKPEWTSPRTYEQNRFYIGLRRQINDIAYEIGYLNQYIFNRRDAMSNVLYFNIAFSDQQSESIRNILLGN